MASGKGVPVKRGSSRRGPGRPGKDRPGALNREVILSLALQMSKTVPLTELSILRVASELGVTPALIHYYVGSRDELTSGVMNAFYKEVLQHWPLEMGEWRHDFELVAQAVYRAYLRYPGIAIYVATQNRYQLFQEVRDDETDYGLLTFEKYVGTIRKMGLDADRTGIFAHLTMAFLSHFAHMTVTHRWPGQSREFQLDKMSALDPSAYPNLAFVRESFANLGATDAFTAGMRLILEAFEEERKDGPLKITGT